MLAEAVAGLNESCLTYSELFEEFPVISMVV